jgi:hypothetical protein
MFGILCVVFVGVAGMARPASADWLLSGFVGPIFNVKTSESDIALAENFDGSTGFGVNLASAFPARANLGFELDWAFYPKAMHTSDVIIDGSSEYFASKLMSISTNFFYSPAVSRFRPYFTVGPTFGYRSDHDDATAVIPSGWAVGINGGGGVIAFVNERFGGRVDFRYQRNFGDFYDIRPDAEGGRSNGWSDLRFFRLFFGGTVVL